MHCWQAGRGISSLDFKVIPCGLLVNFKALEKNTKNWNICLKMFVLAVWIPVWMFMNYGVHMKFLSWIKNSPKTWNIAVNLTEVSSLKTGIKLLIILLIMFFSAISGGSHDGRVFLLFHLICYLTIFEVLSSSLTNELTIMGE